MARKKASKKTEADPHAEDSPASPLKRMLDEDGEGTAETSAAKEPEKECLCFRLGEDLFAVDAHQVLEVLSPIEPVPVPHLPSHIPGVVSHHGRITAVLDMARFCNKEPEDNPKRLVVILGDEAQAAVPVSEILGIQSFHEVEPPLPQSGQTQHFVIGQVRQVERVYSLIDGNALLSSARHRHQATG